MTVGNHSMPSDILETCNEGIFYCFGEWASTVTTGAFWIFMLLAFQFSLFMATIRLGNARSFGFSSFVGLLGGIWLAILGFISWWIASAFIIVGFVGLAVMVVNEK